MFKIENWNGHDIRFVEKEPGDWWAVADDVAKALRYSQATNMLRMVKPVQKGLHLMKTPGGEQEISIISIKGIYAVTMRSRRKEAEDFQEWVYDIIDVLRKASGLEAFQVFRMLDKEHQKEAMKRLNEGLYQPVRVDFIKANSIANKATSSRHGYPKMIKKSEMSPEMLVERQPILDDAVDLMWSVFLSFVLPIKCPPLVRII